MKMKIAALILACLMIVPFIASCGQKNEGAGRNTDVQTTDASTGGDETEDDSVTASQAEIKEIMDYVNDVASKIEVGGIDFTWFGPSNVAVNAPEKDEETGDIMSDAVYYRQRDIEEIYGVKWHNEWGENGEDVADKAENEVMAGGDSYDLVYGSVRSAGTPMLNAGILRTTNDLEYVDLDQRWWLGSLRDTFSINGRLFFLIGPIVVNSYTDTNIILFNKDVTAMFNMDDIEIYDSVKDGKWTIDRMLEVASKIPENASGTGVYRYIEPVGFPFLFSSGLTITKFDEEGTPYVESTLPKEYSDLADKLCAVFSDESQSMFAYYDKEKKDFIEKYDIDQEDAFADGKGLFYFVNAADALYLRNYDVSFGILPMPKLSASQKQYYSFANSWLGGAVYFLKTVKNISMSDSIAESMAALSQIYVKDAYYTKLLKSQAIFDMESRDMLDIIYSTKIYDMADLYAGGNLDNWGEIINVIDKAIRYDSSTFASDYRANARVASMNIRMLIKTLDND
ncbi:MAG: hypothetical protein IKI03_01765 [Clostridia bacterium]|nr:hypothetical protein [Clostridia bacterium]